jgi:hypothetical protein
MPDWLIPLVLVAFCIGACILGSRGGARGPCG